MRLKDAAHRAEEAPFKIQFTVCVNAADTHPCVHVLLVVQDSLTRRAFVLGSHRRTL